MCPQGQRIVTHSATGHCSMCVLLCCCVLFFCWAHLWKERAGWCELAEKCQSASWVFPFFIRPFIPDTDTRARTFRSITSKPYYTESCITAIQLEKTQLVLNETNACAHLPESRKWMSVTPAYGGRWHHTYFHSHIKWQAQMQSANFFGFWDGFKR